MTSYQQQVPCSEYMAEISFNTKVFIAGQKNEELEACAEIVKCNSHHHYEAAILQEASIYELTPLQKRCQGLVMYCFDLLIKN